MEDTKNKKSVVVFLIITLVLSSVCYYIRISGGDAAAGMTSILMWCPAVAALIVKVKFYPKEKLFGWSGCSIKYILAGVFIPIIYLGFSYGLYWIINQTAFTGEIYTNSIGLLLLLIPSSLLTAAGEEIGWRGFLLPKMTEIWNVKISILVSGLIWAVWHFPLMIAGLYQTGTSIWYQLPMFTIEVVAMTAIMAYLRLKSKSIWPAIILHASHNYIDQVICGPLTSANKQAYFVGETGLITAFMLIIVAIIAIRKIIQEGI
ncbi:MAG: CPBP family intramembrane metalloprotease [Clostridiales bacterium]|nr:CPBP family intramembrane metalloprotease [Clostridiales bacterium]